MEEVSYLAYKLARDINILYPEEWDENKKVSNAWLRKFKAADKKEISSLIYSTNCKVKLYYHEKRNLNVYLKNAILTTNNKQLLLTQM